MGLLTLTRDLAPDPGRGEAVAIKVMPKQRGKLAREKTLEKLEREVSVLERCSGAAGRVVELIDCFEAENEVRAVLAVTNCCWLLGHRL